MTDKNFDVCDNCATIFQMSREKCIGCGSTVRKLRAPRLSTAAAQVIVEEFKRTHNIHNLVKQVLHWSWKFRMYANTYGIWEDEMMKAIENGA